MEDQDTLPDESIDIISDEDDESIDTLPDKGTREDIPVLDSIADELRRRPAVIRILIFSAVAFVSIIILLTIALIVTDAKLMKLLHVYLCVGCFSFLVIGLCIIYSFISRIISLRDYQMDDIRQHKEVYNAARSESRATAGIESRIEDRA